MIEGADWLCEQHFGRNLVDRDVEILDPATGTGTFICELLEHFRGQPKKRERKHKERKPKDPTIREKFDSYRFADHKERVIDLLARVARVSVETVRIVETLKGGPR